MNDSVVSATDLRLRFGSTQALAGASIAVAAGEIVSVVGPSGSGKSTLLHCLAGILVPDSGEVTFRSQPVHSMSEAARTRLRRDNFGFVFQFGQLVPELTAIDNVALPLRLRGGSRRNAADAARGWLERLGVADVAGKRPGEMSGGQQQRVAVARAMVADPAVIFADEPTGALDSLNGEQVMELLTVAARERDVSVVLVTHDVRVSSYADRDVVVRDGRVAVPSGLVP